MQVLSNYGAQLNLAIAQGTDFGPVTLTFTNPDTTPLNLTGCTLAAALKSQPLGPVVEPFTMTITDPTHGVATLFMPAATTAALTCGPSPFDVASVYQWDMKLTDASGDVSRPLWGTASVLRSITP